MASLGSFVLDRIPSDRVRTAVYFIYWGCKYDDAQMHGHDGGTVTPNACL